MGAGFSSGWSFDLAGGADTICAAATALGRGALAVIRVSGPGVAPVLRRVCPELTLEEPWRARRVRVVDAAGSTIEDGIGVAYRGPRSYTGEDMAELTVHGSPAVVRVVLEELEAAGCRAAEPGEFTRRAVANGKMDLVQAEGLAALLEAESTAQLRAARAQVSGALSGELGEVRRRALAALATVEGALDLGEELRSVDRDTVCAAAEVAREQMERVLQRARGAEALRGGLRVVIVGASNTGKSTLMNGLVGAPRAIVAEGGGTTRDVVESRVEMAGVPVTVVDTAGVRRSSDPVEMEGMRRTMAAVAEADLVVEVRSAVDGEEAAVPVPVDCEHLVVRSKVDLVSGEWLSQRVGGGEIRAVLVTDGGIATVRRELESRIGGSIGVREDGVSLTQRQVGALRRALEAVDAVDGAEAELAAEGLREAVRELGRLFGTIDSEEVLGEVFAQFCVGK
jgi:tRNA modification GTPase